ncbi:MAG: 50S ribosomal protein L29 [Planctomycetota bacterium]
MSNEQLKAVMKDACKELFNLRIKAQTDRLDVPSELKRNRRLIARIKTIIREREIEQEKSKAKVEAAAG